MSSTPPPPGGGVSPMVPIPSSDNAIPDNGSDVVAAQQQVQGIHVIVDGLLCSIIKANSRSAIEHELVSVIERSVPEIEIREAWWKLFNFFSDACDETRKVKIKDIRRSSNKLMIEDMVRFLKKSDIGLNLNMFALPWYYTMRKFESDSERMSDAFEQETMKDNEIRMNNLEKRLEKRHDDLVRQLHSWSESIARLVKPSYANGDIFRNI